MDNHRTKILTCGIVGIILTTASIIIGIIALDKSTISGMVSYFVIVGLLLLISVIIVIYQIWKIFQTNNLLNSPSETDSLIV